MAGRPARPTLPGGALLPAAYVPTGYVPDGEVTAVTCQIGGATARQGRGAAAPGAHRPCPATEKDRPKPRFRFREQVAGPGSSAGGEVVHDEIAEHPSLVLATGGVEHVAAEDGAERVAVRRPGDAEAADHLMDVERVDVLPEDAGVQPTLQDRVDDGQRRIGQPGQDGGVGQVLGPVDVLDADQPDEV